MVVVRLYDKIENRGEDASEKKYVDSEDEDAGRITRKLIDISKVRENCAEDDERENDDAEDK